MKILLEGPGKRLLRCRCCRVGFLDPQPSLEALTDDFVDRHIDGEARLAGFTTKRDPVLEVISRRIQLESPAAAPAAALAAAPSTALAAAPADAPAVLKILDVGCAGGYFLDRFLPAAGWEKYGAEPSRFASEAAAKKGITVWQGMFASLELPEKFFDVVTVLDAIDYFREPEQEMRKIRRALKPTGALWIEVALGEIQIWRNSSGLARAFSGSSRSLFGSNHLFYYNVASLSHLLKQSGFEVAKVMPSPPIRHNNFYANLLYHSYYRVSALAWKLTLQRWHFGPSVLVKAVPVAGLTRAQRAGETRCSTRSSTALPRK